MTHDTVKEATTAASAAMASKATNIGAATAMAGSFFVDNFVGIVGLFIALAGFLVNWYYRHKEYKLARDKFASTN